MPRISWSFSKTDYATTVHRITKGSNGCSQTLSARKPASSATLLTPTSRAFLPTLSRKGFRRRRRSDSLLLLIFWRGAGMTPEFGPSEAGDCGVGGRNVDPGGGSALPGQNLDGRDVVPSLSGEREAARKQVQPSRSKLNPHEGYILSLIAEAPDITLVEIACRLAAEHGVLVGPSTVWVVPRPARHHIQKRRGMRASSSTRMPCASCGLVRRSTRLRSRAADLHRRHGGADQDGPPVRRSGTASHSLRDVG